MASRRRRHDVDSSTKPGQQHAIHLSLSSGYEVFLRPLPYQTFLRLRERERELFPEPEMPTETVETDSGPVETPAQANSSAGLSYLVALNDVARRRAAYRLDFIIDHFLVVKGAQTDAGRQAIIDAHKGDIQALEDLNGEPITDVWGAVLRHCVLLSSQDYALLQEKALALCTPVTEQEVAQRVNSFRNLLAGPPADGVRESSGT